MKADSVPDNQFLEIELALRSWEESLSSGCPLELMVILMWSEMNGKYEPWFFESSEFPDSKHCHPASPHKCTVKETFEKLKTIQCANVVNADALCW
ncbi:hypothetical protein BC830DRAFT_1175926 [Chytriomyces sp. MP71]|nr:hypothetical protein BC830DRAFT_1175926 [Chytriomyces sp. MP71]